MKRKPHTIFLVAGARPNFMKIAPIHRRMMESPGEFQPVFVHTGQHYDDAMSRVFLEDLGLPEPDVYLGVGSASHAVQTARILTAFEEVVLEGRPDLVMVVGDVNSTVACALAASKLHIPVAHVEAGLRSFDRRMPEEINRVLTDHISDFLFTTCEDGNRNLEKEGISGDKVHYVGNVMIESLLRYRSGSEASGVFESVGVDKGGYALVTLHRPSNVDDRERLKQLLEALTRIGSEVPVVMPAHPRTKKRIDDFALNDVADGLLITPPVAYKDFLALEMNAALVLTDSGGVQEETTIFDVPCLTLRENTERPITIEEGTNILVGTKKERIIEESLHILNGNRKKARVPKYWDDHVSQRIVDVISGRKE